MCDIWLVALHHCASLTKEYSMQIPVSDSADPADPAVGLSEQQPRHTAALAGPLPHANVKDGQVPFNNTTNLL